MRLFLLTQTVVRGYDTFDSCVVVAEDAIAAVQMHPYDGVPISTFANDPYPVWPDKTIHITCEYLGEAHHTYTKPAIICASFNAG